jgi:hypothetical protein
MDAILITMSSGSSKLRIIVLGKSKKRGETYKENIKKVGCSGEAIFLRSKVLTKRPHTGRTFWFLS